LGVHHEKLGTAEVGLGLLAAFCSAEVLFLETVVEVGVRQ